MVCVFLCVSAAKCSHLCVYAVNALDLRLTTNQSDGWRVPHKRTEMKQISVEIKQTFPSRKLPSRGRRAAKHCSVYVSFSGGPAATANEVITRTDDKLLRNKKISYVTFLCSLSVLLCAHYLMTSFRMNSTCTVCK